MQEKRRGFDRIEAREVFVLATTNRPGRSSRLYAAQGTLTRSSG
jgi:hypothetical protein